jgi:hypothetical protein
MGNSLVGYDHVMISQELLDILNESGPGPSIVALCVPEFEQFRKSDGNGCFSLM